MTALGSPQASHQAVGAWRRWRRVTRVGLASLLAIVGLVVEGRSVLLFHTVAPWSSPKSIYFCGREYDRGGVVSALAAQDVAGASPFQRLTWGPLGQPVYGHPASAHQRAELGVPCAMVLYMREGTGYRGFALSGGP